MTRIGQPSDERVTSWAGRVGLLLVLAWALGLSACFSAGTDVGNPGEFTDTGPGVDTSSSQDASGGADDAGGMFLDSTMGGQADSGDAPPEDGGQNPDAEEDAEPSPEDGGVSDTSAADAPEPGDATHPDTAPDVDPDAPDVDPDVDPDAPDVDSDAPDVDPDAPDAPDADPDAPDAPDAD